MCYPYSRYSVFPNLLGDENSNGISVDLMLTSNACYQHSRSFVCDLFIPKCQSNRIIPPCREMCHEYLDGCGHYLIQYMYTFGDRSRELFDCDYLPSTNGPIPCFDIPLQCSGPSRLNDGIFFLNYTNKRNHSVEYSCNEGFTIEGNSTMYCMYNGKWSSEVPVRLPSPKSSLKTEFWILVLTTIFILYILAMVVIIIAVITKLD